MVVWKPKSWDFARKHPISVQIRRARFGATSSPVECFLMEPNPEAGKGENKGTHILQLS